MSGFKRISPEIKAEALARAKTGISVSELANQYGISTKTMYNWLSSGVNGGVSQLELARLKKENSELCRIIGMITMENTKLKKKVSH